MCSICKSMMAFQATSSDVFVGGFACYWGTRGGYVIIVSCEERWVYACSGMLVCKGYNYLVIIMWTRLLNVCFFVTH